MIISDGYTCKGFSLCFGKMDAGDSFVHPNANTAGVNQAVYLYSGNISAVSNGQTIELLADQFVDTSGFANNAITYTAGENGAKWLAINPFPETKKYSISLVTTGTSDIVGSDKETAIICIRGNITCNAANLTPLQYTRVLNNKTITLTVPEGSVAAVITA